MVWSPRYLHGFTVWEPQKPKPRPLHPECVGFQSFQSVQLAVPQSAVAGCSVCIENHRS